MSNIKNLFLWAFACIVMLTLSGFVSVTQITLSIKNKPVKEVIKEIEKNSDYRFFYNDDLTGLNTVVSINVKNGKIHQVMDIITSQAAIAYVVKENNQIVLAAKTDGQQQGRTVGGIVIDNNGEPLAGATLIEKGTANGTVTNVDGKFSLTVANNAVLQVSFIGYTALEVATGNQTNLTITLTEDSKLLEEVVVVGYGTQKKINLTGSIATLKAEDIQSVPSSNLSNALSGRLTGVYINQSLGGRPGNSSDIAIRAKGTWNSSDPLYVIDGVVRDKFAFDGLNANDVENLSILKDAASAAIYGSRSANGVVLVTTKRGQTGKPVIAYSGSIGASSPTQYPKTQDAYHQALFINDGLRTEGRPADYTGYYAPDELDYYKTHSYDWMAEAMKNPIVTNHALNVSGGNDRVRYFIGGSYYNEAGMFNNMQFDKYTLRNNIEAYITKNLVATMDLNTDMRDDLKPYWVNDNRNDSMYDLFGLALLYTPSIRPAYINGLPVANDMSNNFMEMVSSETSYNKRRYLNMEANISLRYDVPVVPGLSLKLLYNNYNRNQFTKEFAYPHTWYTFKTTGTNGHILTDEIDAERTYSGNGNFLNENYTANRSYQLNGFVNYDRRFGKHDLSAVLVYEQSEGYDDYFRAEIRNFSSNLVDQIVAGNPDDDTVGGNGAEKARTSYAGRVHYGYDDKYLVEVSMRYDGSVNFTPDRRWGFFPSASAAWRISEESFFKDNISFITNLKLRGSVGLLGNDLIRDANGNALEWQWVNRYDLTTGAYYGGGAIGVSPNVIPNIMITWEKSLNYEGGLDIGLLDNKLTLGLGAFKKHTYDILGTRINILPTTFGGTMPAENYGVIDTHGYEIEAAYTDKIGDDFTWRINGNLGYAVNKIIKKDEAENLPAYRSEIGYNTDRARGFIYTDIIRTQAELDALLAKYPDYTIRGEKPELGMINYKDIRGVTGDEPDGKITDEDQDWTINHSTPPIVYGFAVGGEWKGLALDLFFQGVSGNDLFINYRDQNARAAKINSIEWDDHWTPDNTDAKYPRAEKPNSKNYPASTFWQRDGSFLRLKHVNLSYAVPKSFLSSLGVSQLKIFYVGANLLLMEDHVKEFDPEFGNVADNWRRYPVMKSHSFGINLSF